MTVLSYSEARINVSETRAASTFRIGQTSKQTHGEDRSLRNHDTDLSEYRVLNPQDNIHSTANEEIA